MLQRLSPRGDRRRANCSAAARFGYFGPVVTSAGRFYGGEFPSIFSLQLYLQAATLTVHQGNLLDPSCQYAGRTSFSTNYSSCRA